MLLENKNAVVYGGGGAVGGAVARAFAREGAKVFLAGRTLATLEVVAEDIRAAGGAAEVARVDALNEQAVEDHADEVAARSGRIDVSFNAISHGDVHGLLLLDLPLEDFIRPIATAMRAHFLTMRAATRRMVEQRSGTILTVTATTARQAIPQVGGTGVTFDAIESLCRQWACEVGRFGVRVAWLHTTGIAEAIHADVAPDYGTGKPMSRAELVAWMENRTMLGRVTSLADVGNAAAFLASDRAGAMTASAANLTCGGVPTR